MKPLEQVVMKPAILVIQRRSPQLLEALSRDYIVHDYGRAEDKDAFVANIGGDGGQEVPHFHVHILGGRPLGRMVAKQAI